MSQSKLRLAFMGTPAFAVPVLRALVAAGHEVVAVYSQPPKPAGRGHQVQLSPVHRAAEDMGIPVFTPRQLRGEVEQQQFRDLNLDAAIVVAYGLILPQAVLDAPRLGCLNIHFSLLPRWRGAAPVARAMLAGDAETGVCIMQMAAGLDTGDVLLRDVVPVAPTVTADALLTELTEIGVAQALKALEGLRSGTLKAVPQSNEGVTYAAKLTKEDGRIDWVQSAAFIERQIRALHPWPGCFFMLGHEPVKVLKAELTSGQGDAGVLLADDFTVACGEGALRLVVVQRAGKKPTDGASFLRGARLKAGQKL